jgi:hypothetical protein
MPDRLASHLQCVDVLKNAGVEIPQLWEQTRARFDEVDATGEIMLNRLIAAVLGDTDGDLPALYSAAVSEGLWENSDRVREPLRHHTVARLEEVFQPLRAKAYGAVANRFNSAARQFADCARAVDPEATADEVIRLPAKQQRCWREAREHAAVMDKSLEPLRCAALLCGSLGEVAGTAFDAPTLLIPLVIENIGSLHRRQVWRCWENFVPAQAPPIKPMTTKNMREPEQPNPGRTGKWGKLLGINAVLRAHPHPDRIELYRRPEPKGVRFEYDARGYRSVPFDPEGDVDPDVVIGTPDRLEGQVLA